MLWPSRIDYTQAVGGYSQYSMLDLKLKGGTPRRGANNDLISYSGGFSIVFPVDVLSNTYALRCWITDIEDAETRYNEISNYLKQCGLPYFVDFAYVPQGILVNGNKYSITRMEWAEGNTLCDFIKQNFQDARCLKTTAAEFQKMVKTLHAHQISHGDLQDGNILLKRNGAGVEIKLIDYDSLFVPALRGQPDNIVGLAEYQHPQRITGGRQASEKVDYFSELVIFLSFVALAEKPALWNQFGNRTERALLFTVEDFKNPAQSDVFRDLENLSPDVAHLASKLKGFCNLSIDQLEPLEAVLPKSSPAQAAYDQGLAYLHCNRYSEAIVEFEKAIVLDPNYKEAHHGLGLAQLQMSNFGAAKKAAEAALGIDIRYQPALQLLDALVLSTNPRIVIPPSPSKKSSTPTPTKPVSQAIRLHLTSLNRWQYLTGGLAFALAIFLVAFLMQMNSKNEAIRENQELRNQLAGQGTELTLLNNKNQTLRSKNTNLQKQLDDDKQPDPEQVALENENAKLWEKNQTLQNENQKLRLENTALQKQQNRERNPDSKQVTLDNESTKLQEKNQTLQNENRKLRLENAALRKQQNRERNPDSKQVTLDNESTKLQEKNQTLQNENRKLRLENAELQKQLKRAKNTGSKQVNNIIFDNDAYFTVGSTKDEVVAIQGTPTSFSESKFDYGASRVHFRNGRVSSWDNNTILNPLKAKMVPAPGTRNRGYFTTGSTKDEVIAIQGTPTSFSENKFDYGASRVHFRNGRVSSWDNNTILNPLKAKMVPAPGTRNRGYFTTGSTKDEVIAIQGTPTSFSENKFDYGASRVHFRNGRVSSWDNNTILNPLSAKMVPAQNTRNRGYFTTGSTKDEVVAVQGTPTSFSENKFEYGASRVYFRNGRVSSWDNNTILNPLKVR